MSATTPEATATAGQPFLKPQSKTGGELAQHPQTEVPEGMDDTQVSPQEQDQYDDFVTRARLFINDPRPPLNAKGSPIPNGKAPRDLIIDHLNVENDTADAVGRTTAQVAWIISQNAKQQGYPYSPDVLYHGADEIMSDLYMIGVHSKVIKNPPPENSTEEEHLLGLAKLAAVKYYGKNLIDSGQANSKEAQQYYLDQIKREGDSGELDNWNPDISPGQVQEFMRKGAEGDLQIKGPQMPRSAGDFEALGHPRVVPPDGAAPPDQGAAPAPPPPDQAAAAPPPDDAAPPPGGV